MFKRADAAEFNFNSSMVRLKPNDLCHSLKEFHYFNSSMVRLKLEICCAIASYQALFQFLYGSIKACTPAKGGEGIDSFQFLYGSIKANGRIDTQGGRVLFQFLYGSIKAILRFRGLECRNQISIPLWFD